MNDLVFSGSSDQSVHAHNIHVSLIWKNWITFATKALNPYAINQYFQNIWLCIWWGRLLPEKEVSWFCECDCALQVTGEMKRLHKSADSCHMISNAFWSGHLAFANIATNMLIIWKGLREKPCEIFWWEKKLLSYWKNLKNTVFQARWFKSIMNALSLL